ncbi:MAG: hypothetical protein LBL45_06690 [Treponema sp.]|jgi:hypothetical protein|nr:hypothetical protein [Treponema sp.]
MALQPTLRRGGVPQPKVTALQTLPADYEDKLSAAKAGDCGKERWSEILSVIVP